MNEEFQFIFHVPGWAIIAIMVVFLISTVLQLIVAVLTLKSSKIDGENMKIEKDLRDIRNL